MVECTNPVLASENTDLTAFGKVVIAAFDARQAPTLAREARRRRGRRTWATRRERADPYLRRP